MRPRDVERDHLLDALYRELPSIECKGECAESCGPIPLTRHERGRVRAALRAPLTCDFQQMRCSAWAPGLGCRAYAVRPMICRLWGLVETMPCVFGCVPDRLLTHEEGHEFLRRAEAIGGRVDFTL